MRGWGNINQVSWCLVQILSYLTEWWQVQNSFLTDQKQLLFLWIPGQILFSLLSPSSRHSLLTHPLLIIFTQGLVVANSSMPVTSLDPKNNSQKCVGLVCIFLILQMQKLSIRPELNSPAWGINSMVKSGPKFQSSDSRLRARSTSPILPLSRAWIPYCLAHNLVLNYFVILEVTAFIGTQSNLRRAKVLLCLVLLVTHSFSESKRSPENGTSVMCCKGHRNN